MAQIKGKALGLNHHIGLRVAPSMYKYLTRRAEDSYMKVPEYIRQLIVDDMEKWNNGGK